MREENEGLEKLKNFFEDTKQKYWQERTIYLKGEIDKCKETGSFDTVLDSWLSTEKSAMVDALTGAYTQVGVLQQMLNLIPNLHRQKVPCSVVVCDVDNLKLVNDTKGHKAGDELLKRLVEVMGQNIRLGDFLGRWTKGDEFVLVLIDCDQENAGKIVSRIRENLPETIGFSAGLHQLEDYDFLAAVNKADKKMYEDKKQRKSVQK
jgi:diguanylate cyclase (GGDEF)-like protein